MAISYLLLGSNLGDRNVVLKRAAEMLQDISVSPIIKSALYYCEPWGFKAEEWFLNQVVAIDTNLNPVDLLKNILEFERVLGRERPESPPKEKRYASRVIDIDILLYQDYVTFSPQLQIPHPRMHLRKFALVPLCEIAPQIIHPIHKVSIENLLDNCPDTSAVSLIQSGNER